MSLIRGTGSRSLPSRGQPRQIRVPPPCSRSTRALTEQDFGRAQATDAPMGRVHAFRGLSRSHTPLGVTGAPCGRGFRHTVERC